VGRGYLTLGILHLLVSIAFTFVFQLLNHQCVWNVHSYGSNNSLHHAHSHTVPRSKQLITV